MGVLNYVLLAFTHPNELRSMISYKVWRNPVHTLEDDPEASGINRESMQKCWTMLDETSRSFAMVIKELRGDLARTICLYYLVLRALDTVEDDMTIDIDIKNDLLINFHKRLTEPGWTFSGCGPDEKDRHVLEQFDVIISELGLLEKHYRDVIVNITAKMGLGMAHYCRQADQNDGIFSVKTLGEYDLYCHFVAGLVGEGLSQLATASGLEDEKLGRSYRLSNSMGLFLQKTNILRDFREDIDSGRLFWPKEIWGKYVDDPRHLTYPTNVEKAINALSEMVFDALTHIIDVLNYMSNCKDQSYFNFCAIPQAMAIGTLELCYNNIDVYHKNVKLRRGQTVQLIMKASNPRDLAIIFHEHIGRIAAKANPHDPCYLKYSILLGQVEQWLESHYPSWVADAAQGSAGAQAIPMFQDDDRAAAIPDNRVRQLAKTPPRVLDAVKKQTEATTLSWEDKKLLAFIVLAVVGIFVFLALGSSMLIIYMSGGSVSDVMRQIYTPIARLTKDFGHHMYNTLPSSLTSAIFPEPDSTVAEAITNKIEL